jgi:hypothetical protein
MYLICRSRREMQSEKMDYSPTILLMPHNYFEWKLKILHQLRCRGLYRITMETEVELDSADEKNDFLNTQDMALGLICMSISPKLQYHVEEESLSTLNELWTRLEVLFGNKEGCEDCMQKIDKIEPTGNPWKIKPLSLKSLLHRYLHNFVFHSLEMMSTPFQICFLNHI